MHAGATRSALQGSDASKREGFAWASRCHASVVWATHLDAGCSHLVPRIAWSRAIPAAVLANLMSSRPVRATLTVARFSVLLYPTSREPHHGLVALRVLPPLTLAAPPALAFFFRRAPRRPVRTGKVTTSSCRSTVRSIYRGFKFPVRRCGFCGHLIGVRYEH